MKLYKEDQHFIYAASYQDPILSHLTGKIRHFMIDQNRGRVLDLGCGTGRNAIMLAKEGFSLVGIDSSDVPLHLAKVMAAREGVSSRCRFVRANVITHPRSFGRFDYCIISEVIEHVGDRYQKLVDYAYASLKKGGFLILTTPSDPAQWSVLDDYAQHTKRFTHDDMKKLLKKFRNTETVTIGFPLMRFLIRIYTTFIRVFHLSHEPRRLRGNTLIDYSYYLFARVLLSFDELFNKWGKGTTFFIVAQK